MKLTEDQKAKLEKCESKEEILKLVDEENIELDDGDLEKINGGESIFHKQAKAHGTYI